MLSAAVWLMLSSMLTSLRISGGGSFPKPLTAEEERMYLQRSAAGDLEACNILIERNLRLVAHIMKKYYSQSADQEDLISIGTIGLIKAVNTFDPQKKIKLATYASRCIENEILMCLRSSQKRRGDVSLHEPIGVDSEGNEMTLSDVLGTDEGAVHEAVERRVSLQSVRRLVQTQLHGRERTVLELRYGLLDGRMHPQQEIARQLGVSRSYISRIEKKAMERLKHAFESGAADPEPAKMPVQNEQKNRKKP